MTANPVSLREDASVHEAAVLLTDRGISAAPVIDEAGRPVGVLSRADIVVHDRESAHDTMAVAFYEHEAGEYGLKKACRPSFHLEHPDPTCVRDIMTPAVFSIAPDAPASRVVEDMVVLNVHRLFVVGRDGVLIGVIAALDVLRHLRPEQLSVRNPVPASACDRPVCGD